MLPLLANIPPPPSNAIHLGPLEIRYYGIAIALGVLLAVFVARRRFGRYGGDPALVDRTALWAVLFGVVGARAGFLLWNFDRFVDRPLEVFAVWQGGLVLFGGLTAGAIAAIVVIHRSGANLAAFVDAAAPAVPLAQAVGRWGNYFNQELYGTPTELPWALQLERGGEIVDTVHPTFLYESLWNLGLAGVLIWIGLRHKLRRGSLLFCYAIGYGFVRFLLELIRTDTEFRLLGISRNGYAAAALFLAGIVGLVWHQRRALLPGADDAATDEPVTSPEEEEAREDADADTSVQQDRAGGDEPD